MNSAGSEYTMFNAARLASGIRSIAEIMAGPQFAQRFCGMFNQVIGYSLFGISLSLQYLRTLWRYDNDSAAWKLKLRNVFGHML